MFPIIGMSIALSHSVVNYAGGAFCQIAAYPSGCNKIEGMMCQRGANEIQFRWALMLAPNYVAILIFYVALVRVFCRVRNASMPSVRSSLTGTTSRRQRQVTVQCLLYAIAFFNQLFWGTTWDTMVVIQDAPDMSRMFPLLILGTLFYPLQGAVNLLIFSRPRYLRFRERYPGQSCRWALYQSIMCREGEAPQFSHESPPEASPIPSSNAMSQAPSFQASSIKASSVQQSPKQVDDSDDNKDLEVPSSK